MRKFVCQLKEGDMLSEGTVKAFLWKPGMMLGVVAMGTGHVHTWPYDQTVEVA